MAWTALSPIGVSSSTGSVFTKQTDNVYQFSTFTMLSQMVVRTKNSDLTRIGYKVFPTLASEQTLVTVNLPKGISEKASLEISDALGRTVFQKNTEGVPEVQISVADWVRGLYLVRLTDGENTSSQKFIKN